MEIFLCIDDTDNIDSKGTGEIASEIASLIEANEWGTCGKVTRHQLLVHPDVPYTSHNSSMCFSADIKSESLNEIISAAVILLERESAEGSDPGLCVFVPEQLTQLQHQLVVNFGQRAKKEVLKKQDAYALAKELSIHLSEHGGTGQGIIGALAGVGLRLTGNDGRFKGNHKLKTKEKVVSVQEVLNQTSIDVVRTKSGLILNEDELVTLGEKVKSVLLDHKSAMLVELVEVDGVLKWQSCFGHSLKQY